MKEHCPIKRGNYEIDYWKKKTSRPESYKGKYLRHGVIHKTKKNCLSIACRFSFSFYLICALAHKFPNYFWRFRKSFSCLWRKTGFSLEQEESTSLLGQCKGSIGFFITEDMKSNTPNCEKETKPEHFVGFVTRFSRASLPTRMVLVLPLPIVCVYIKDDQLSVCFSTGSYQETYATRSFQMAALSKQLQASSSSCSSCTTLASGTETPPLSSWHSLVPLPSYPSLCTSSSIAPLPAAVLFLSDDPGWFYSTFQYKSWKGGRRTFYRGMGW